MNSCWFFKTDHLAHIFPSLNIILRGNILKNGAKNKNQVFLWQHTPLHSLHFVEGSPQSTPSRHAPFVFASIGCLLSASPQLFFICATRVLRSDTYWIPLSNFTPCFDLISRTVASTCFLFGFSVFLPTAYVLFLIDPRCFSTLSPRWSKAIDPCGFGARTRMR